MTETKNNTTKNILISLGIVTGTALLAALVLWLTGYYVTAAIVATALVGMWLGIYGFVLYRLGRRDTVHTVREIAEIVLRSQQVNEEWNARQTIALTSIFQAGAKSAGQAPMLPRPDIITLPGDSVAEWMPPIQTFHLGDGDDEKSGDNH